jgi:SAM-dependent methyltransferase
MTWYREWFGEEYLDLYSYRDEEEARRHVDFFAEHIGHVHGPILDLACGSGRHVQELSSRGYRVTGCDLSWVLLRTGILRGVGGMVRGDMRELPFADAAFAGLVNFFTSFGYFATDHDNGRVVSEMSRVLGKGSPFLFDYLNVNREISRMVQRETRETESGPVVIERWFDVVDRAFNKRITFGDKRFIERVRAYDLDEISMMFASCRLSIHEVFGDFDGSGYDQESPRLIAIGTKK